MSHSEVCSGSRGGVTGRLLGAVLAAVALVWAPVGVAPSAHAADHHTIVLTFVRHGRSAANAAGIIDTAVPGPDLTDLGQQQAHDVANQLSVNRYDGIYASTMVRTQETAGPLSQALGEPITVLPGLREIEVGSNEETIRHGCARVPRAAGLADRPPTRTHPGGDRRRGIRGGVQ